MLRVEERGFSFCPSLWFNLMSVGDARDYEWCREEPMVVFVLWWRMCAFVSLFRISIEISLYFIRETAIALKFRSNWLSL